MSRCVHTGIKCNLSDWILFLNLGYERHRKIFKKCVLEWLINFWACGFLHSVPPVVESWSYIFFCKTPGYLKLYPGETTVLWDIASRRVNEYEGLHWSSDLSKSQIHPIFIPITPPWDICERFMSRLVWPARVPAVEGIGVTQECKHIISEAKCLCSALCMYASGLVMLCSINAYCTLAWRQRPTSRCPMLGARVCQRRHLPEKWTECVNTGRDTLSASLEKFCCA